MGKVLLAHAAEQLFEEAVARPGCAGYTAHTVVAPGQLRRELAEIRRTGVAYAREEMTLGSQSVAAPVLDADGGPSRRWRSPCGPAGRCAPARPGGTHRRDLDLPGLQQRALLTRDRGERTAVAMSGGPGGPLGGD